MSRIDRRLMVAMSALFLAVAAVGPARAASPLTEQPTGTPKVATVEKQHPRPEVGREATDQHGPKGKNLPCIEKVHDVKDQGPSCRVANGLFKVRLSDGSVTYTHGPDALHDDDHDHGQGAHHHDEDDAPGANGQTGDLGTITARNPVCTSANPHGAYGFHAVIAIPADGSQSITAASFRSLLQQVDGSIYKSAVESGSPNGADLVFDCDGTGAIAVDVVRLATSTANDSFSSIVGDLKNLGFQSATRNYAVYYTAALVANGPGGQGSLNADSSNSASNTNNTGGRYAIDYGVATAETIMHEIGHNLGAVQPDAPHATGSSAAGNWGHCWEGKDVMCYNDGASRDPRTITWNCLDFDHFDCGHDDYFDAKIGAGQGGSSTAWLGSHFNIGACYDVFIVNAACAAVGDVAPPTVAAPAQTMQYLGTVAAGLIPVTYSWSATDPSGIGQYDAWISTNGGNFGQLTLGSPTATSGTWSLTPGSSYQMAVRARDTAGNWSTYVYGPVFTVDAFQENATAHVAISTGWTAYTGSYFGGRQYSSGVTGSSATFTFTGRGFAWYAARATNRGEADVWVDDTYIGRVDTYATSTSLATAVLNLNWTTSASHKVKVQVVGTLNRPTIDVDAMVALR